MMGPDEESIKIVHVSMLGMQLSRSPGFKAQLECESHAAESLRISSGIDWSTVLLVPGGNDDDYADFCVPVVKIPRIYRGRLARRHFLWAYVRKVAKQTDVVLVRHSVIDPFESLALRDIPNLAVVHHTKDVEELRAGGHLLLSRIEAALQWLNRRWGQWPIGVTAELAQYATGRGSKARSEMVLPNGIELPPMQANIEAKRTDHEIIVLFVASRFISWHGLDRLLVALMEWSPHNNERIALHLVGALTDDQLAATARIPGDRVKIVAHGVLSREEISQLASEANIGIGSLALDRMAMRDACTLKVREYLAAGLPVYATHRDSGLPDEFAYYYRDDTVNISHLVTFAVSMLSVTTGQVRLAAEPYISKEAIMRRASQGMLRDILTKPGSMNGGAPSTRD